MRYIVLVGSIAAGACFAATLSAQSPEGCPGGVGPRVEEGWRLYRAGRVEDAERLFQTAVSCDAEALGARVGLAYARLRRGDAEAALEHFALVLAADSTDVDAWTGRALIFSRRGEGSAARHAARRALRLEPDYPDAVRLLRELEADAIGADGHERLPLPPRPETVVYPARVLGDGFQVRTSAGWRDLYIKGVNIGGGLPGRYPSEFPDAEVYAELLSRIADAGANTVRVYTIHPPAFYRALYEHNVSHADRPLWLIHGVWAELPPGDDFANARWEAGYWAEMRRVVDLIHGRADLPPRAGRSEGEFTADVSPWTLAFILGREWEPASVGRFNDIRPELTRWRGDYLQLESGTPMEAWLARASEQIVAYEMEVYRAQRPVAYTNWPTLDPLRHPTEATAREEIAIRRALGERIIGASRQSDDQEHLDATRARPKAAFPAGTFASFHVYPYHPAFMTLSPEYEDASSPWGPSRYFGYLSALKAAHPNMPVLIAEYGVPASLGISHIHPEGRHHGGHTEPEQARITSRLTREIAAAGMAGGLVFSWSDEWHKTNWLVSAFEAPFERGRYWLNRLDPEEHYGLLAMEPVPAIAGSGLEDRLAPWRERPALYQGDGTSLRAAADAAYLWLLYESEEPTAELRVGFDLLDEAGDARWPDRAGPSVEAGLEFALRIDEREARLVVHPPYNPFRLVPLREGLDLAAARSRDVGGPSGTGAEGGVSGALHRERFQGRLLQVYNAPWERRQSTTGRYDSLRVVTNPARFARDGREYLALGYDRGVLPHGAPPDGLWEWRRDGRLVEIRVPWILINVIDPSSRRTLSAAERPATWAEVVEMGIPTAVIDGIGIAAAAVDQQGTWRPWPKGGAGLARFSWPTWEEPTWRSRERPLLAELRRVWTDIEGFVARSAAPRVTGGGER